MLAIRHHARELALWMVLALVGCTTLAGCGGSSAKSNSKPSGGTGMPQLVATPASIDFGTVTMGTKATQSITLSNPGTASVTVSQGSVSATTFSIKGLTAPLAIAPGQASTFSIEFAPTAAGAVSGQFRLMNNSATSPVVVSLTGTGSTGTSKTFSILGTISNGAGASLKISGAVSATTTADGFGNYGFSGLPNGSYSVTPTRTGLSFAPSSQDVTVNGANVAGVNFTGTSDVTVSISPASASVATGSTQQFTVTVTGASDSSVTWSANGGSVSSTGLYTAPDTASVYTVTATSVTDSTKSASANVNVTSATTSDVLLGDQSVENQANSIVAGQAEAFQATAKASGNLKSLVLYLDANSTVAQLVAGLYADAGGHPGTRLVQGSSTPVVKGAWNAISLPSTNVVAGTPYWIAILGTGSGTLAFRTSSGGGCNAETDSRSALISLPSDWSSGALSSNCPASVFGVSSTVIFFDNFPGTSLSPFWTIINRHGEYSQNETECNIPQQVSVANGLTITTSAHNSVCGDFNPDGTVWHVPSSWPYVTGDIQWANFSFTYGTVEIRAKFPDQQTSLWPATWLAESNCQSTNPFTGETGVGNCPSLGSAGYTEIDMTECYGSGWCQFHVADPSFGIGNGCDADYAVDSNWHTFTTVWNSSGITQSRDGVTQTICNQQLSNPMFLLIQTQTGGSGGTPNNMFLPASLEVDYVKVTQP
jgi:hypothetical protein